MRRTVIALQMVAKVYPLELSHVNCENLLPKAILVNPVRRPLMECCSHFDRLKSENAIGLCNQEIIFFLVHGIYVYLVGLTLNRKIAMAHRVIRQL